MNQKCKDPCLGSCGVNAECRVVSHTPMCVCPSDYSGDPFIQCILRPCKIQDIFLFFFFNLSIIIKDFRFSLSFKLRSNFDIKSDVEQLKSLIIITRQFNNFFPSIILLFVLQLSSCPWKSFSMYPVSMRVQCDMQRTKWCRLVLLFIRLYW